jgi:hypothetical protein
MVRRMEHVAAEIERIVSETVPRLRAIGAEGSRSVRPGGAWTGRQVLGHLIDSAANNHQRFVRAQFVPELTLPGYEADAWVDAQGYVERDWEELVGLWAALNRHVAAAARRIPAECRSRPCRIGDGERVTLDFLVRDYVNHLQHHLAQILTPREAEGRRYTPLPV